MRDYGRPIYEASSRSCLLSAFIDCITGHESLIKAGLLFLLLPLTSEGQLLEVGECCC